MENVKEILKTIMFDFFFFFFFSSCICYHSGAVLVVDMFYTMIYMVCVFTFHEMSGLLDSRSVESTLFLLFKLVCMWN